jgi:hypothetical protein
MDDGDDDDDDDDDDGGGGGSGVSVNYPRRFNMLDVKELSNIC